MLPIQPHRDLLGRPGLCAEQFHHVVPQPRPLLEPLQLGTPRVLIGTMLRTERPIRPTAAARLDLPADGPPMTADPSSDQRVGLTTLDPNPDLFAALERQRTRTRFAVAEHDPILFGEPTPQRPLRDPGQRRRIRV